LKVRSGVGVLTLLGLATVNVSCGRSDGPPLYPVHGKVIYNGQPAVGATVSLRREGPALPGTEALGPLVPSGRVDEDGNFSVALDDFGYGAPVGQYKALIQWRVPGNVSPPEPAPAAKSKKSRKVVFADKPDGVPDRLQGRFMNPDKSTFVVEVKAEDNALQPFDVSH
jgi:hypothetical protein